MSNHIQTTRYAVAFTRSATQIATDSQVQICNQIAEQLGVQIIGWYKAEGEQSTTSEAFPIVARALNEARTTQEVRYFITSDCSRLTRHLEVFSEIVQSLQRHEITLATRDAVISSTHPT